jgi:hypothetical protein
MLVPAALPPHPGWHSGHTAVHACPGVAASRCVQATTWAATIRWRDCADCLPHRTVAALPTNGIALQVTVAVEHPVPGWLPHRAWPPSIAPRDVAAPFEGLPAQIGVYQHVALEHGVEVSAMVFFGRPRPTAQQAARAAALLARLKLP